MNTNELNLGELDAWIAEHVFGYHKQQFNNGYESTACNLMVDKPFRADKFRKHGWHKDYKLVGGFPHYTADAAASDALDDKIRERCGEDGYSTYMRGNDVHMLACLTGLDAHAIHPDKKICRALFAKKLWGGE